MPRSSKTKASRPSPIVRTKRSNKKTLQVTVVRMYPDVEIPTMKNKGDVGYDLSSHEKFSLAPGERRTISTGLAFGIPEGYYGKIETRSSLAKIGVVVSGGVIDQGYIGEVKVVLTNHGKEAFDVDIGRKIAQILFKPVLTNPLIEVDSLTPTERGSKGFGSTDATEPLVIPPDQTFICKGSVGDIHSQPVVPTHKSFVCTDEVCFLPDGLDDQTVEYL